MNADATIAEAGSAADMAEIRALFVEYQQWLGVDLCFKDFAEEIDDLPGRYAPPAGSLLLARTLDGAVAGGVGMWPLELGVCEMKRLFVRPLIILWSRLWKSPPGHDYVGTLEDHT